MSRYDYDLGIIGGGAAGLTAAAGAAQFGAKTILIEKSAKLGGDCLHYGCVPSKTLIRTAGVYALMKRTTEFGLPQVELPPVDLEAVMNRVKSVIDKIQQHDSPERFCNLGAQAVFGNAFFIDDHSVNLDGQNLSARSWIISTGSSPALPPVEGLANTPYLTNETIFSQKKLPARLIVLGGGPIGLELAQAMGRLGSQVTIVEFLDQILGPEDPDIAGILQQQLKEEGITIYKATKAVKAQYDDSLFHLTIADTTAKGQTRILNAEALLVAAGRKPNIDGLKLEAAGVKFTPRGIPTDSNMKTNIKHIYACGDVNGQLPFTHVAGYEAGIALTNAILRLHRKADYAKIGWCTYTDPEIASIGYNEKRAKEKGIKYRVWEEQYAENDRAQAEGATKGKIKLLVSPAGKFIGCQIIGAHAGDLIHEWVIALNGGIKLSTIAAAVHIYPTISEVSKRVTGKIFAEKIFSERTKNILKFIFSLKGRACQPTK
ncbi:MAG: NAD(P)/FAD-dependent oxidoreductase [Smithella sp.]|jgi:pyruvate/2-oxoglutarate dehydrogenase complex dihydrolipoamide dehydrogenase (E3) component